MREFGVIGITLKHSFSPKYFADKFAKEGIKDASYHPFEIHSIADVESLLKKPNIKGLNVTLPYKEQVLPYLESIDSAAAKIGAVNTIKVDENGAARGYNTDYYGFKISLEQWINPQNLTELKAMVLGTGGASKAVVAALADLNVPFIYVSSSDKEGSLSYNDITKEVLDEYKLIINTTPLGMFPNNDEAPSLPYQHLTEGHFLYDLIYNPEVSLFLQYGEEIGAQTMNGYEMLVIQAEKSWEIWNA
jgi:shikimate dehydrogenase